MKAKEKTEGTIICEEVRFQNTSQNRSCKNEQMFQSTKWQNFNGTIKVLHIQLIYHGWLY